MYVCRVLQIILVSVFCWVCLPLGDSLAGGPSINVGGERKGLVSEAGRPRGEGPYGDLSARNARKE